MADNIFPYTCFVSDERRANCAPVCLVGGKEKAEVLELLAFWKPEQQAAHHFRIWRPVKESPLQHQPSIIRSPPFFRLEGIACPSEKKGSRLYSFISTRTPFSIKFTFFQLMYFPIKNYNAMFRLAELAELERKVYKESSFPVGT